MHVNRNYNTCVGIMGRDHVKHTTELQKNLEVRPWIYFTYPVLRINKKKLSKRNNNIVYYNELISQMKEKLNISSFTNCQNILRLQLIRYSNRDVVNLEEILCDSKILSKMLDISEIDTQENPKANKLLETWSNLDLVIQKCIRNQDLNILYKFLERVHFLRKKETNKGNLKLHNRFLKLFKIRLGLL